MARLKQHHVYRVVVAYAVAAWIVIQVTSRVFPYFGWNHFVPTIIIILLLGFPVVLILAWLLVKPKDPVKSNSWLRRHWAFGATLSAAVVVLVVISGFYALRFSEHYEQRMTEMTVAKTAVAVSPPTPAAVTAIPAKSIAVLPFDNLNVDKKDAYFVTGMQDLILTKLADIGDLKVIARTSTQQYASHPDNLTAIAQQLGVATLLEGSVQKAGNQVLINVQLIDAKTDAHIWAQSYQRTLNNIFGVEGEVAQKVADALSAKLTPAETARVANVPTTNAAAYDAYLRGEHYLDRMSAGDFKVLPKAVAAFQQAVNHDPAFALAWARLAFSRSALMYASIDRSDATRQQALANAQHALALARDLPQAHYALGYVYRFDFAAYDKALAQFKIARRGLPNDAKVEAAIAYIQEIQGKPQAAVSQLQRAVALDPRDPNLAFSLGKMLERLRQYDRAGIAFQRMLAIAPEDPEVYTALAWLEVLQHGDVHAALAILDKAPADLQSGPEILSRRVELLLLKRDYKSAQQAVDTLRPGGRFVTPLKVLLLRAEVSHFSGDLQSAKALCQQALANAKTLASEANSEGALEIGTLIPIAQACLRHRAEALQALENLRALARKTGVRLFLDEANLVLAQVDAILGDANAAIAPLDAAMAAPLGDDISVPLLKLDPQWDTLRGNPRFQALLKKYETVNQNSEAGNSD
ncbi:MAG: tetratricopeptide repeat protein [Gammaproteobacteria bacterium]